MQYSTLDCAQSHSDRWSDGKHWEWANRGQTFDARRHVILVGRNESGATNGTVLHPPAAKNL